MGLLQSWRDGAAASPAACAWRELEARHDMLRRGARVHAQPAQDLIDALQQLGLQDRGGKTILHYGAAAAAPKVLAALLRRRSLEFQRRPELLTLRDGLGESPLTLAADNDTLALLLEAGVPIGTDCLGTCCHGALSGAARHCMNAELIQSLLAVCPSANGLPDNDGQ